MILPIVAYGHPVLKKVAEPIESDSPELQELIDSMFETMHHASGVGLAAPQIGKSIRLFIIDSTLMLDEESEEEGLREVFINARVIEETGTEWTYEEGCLSIPEIRENVDRPPRITLRYLDREFREHERSFTGITARVIQHEYDHIEGVLFTDHIAPLRKRMLKGKLRKISQGRIDPGYRMVLPK